MRALSPAPLVVLAATVAVAADRPEGRSFATRSGHVARHGMVCAGQPLAVQIGLDVLKRGGSAVDAAIAVNAALGLMEPTASGLGGDLFAIVWDPAQRQAARPQRLGPRAAGAHGRQGPARLADGTIPPYSPYAWTVPGCRRRLVRAARDVRQSSRCARSSRRRSATPRRAFPSRRSSPRLGARRPRVRGQARLRRGLPARRQAPRPRASVFPNPALAAHAARSLATAAATPSTRARSPTPSSPSRSRTAASSRCEDFVAPHRRLGRADLDQLPRLRRLGAAAERPGARRAADARTSSRGSTSKAMGRDSADFWHLHGRGQEARLRRPGPLLRRPGVRADSGRRRCSKELRERQAARIDIDPQPRSRSSPATPACRDGDTTYLVTADERGMMVSLIQSNYTGFGSGYVVPALGFGLQNRGALVLAAAGPPQRPRARQAAVPHHHPGLRRRRTASR